MLRGADALDNCSETASAKQGVPSVEGFDYFAVNFSNLRRNIEEWFYRQSVGVRLRIGANGLIRFSTFVSEFAEPFNLSKRYGLASTAFNNFPKRRARDAIFIIRITCFVRFQNLLELLSLAFVAVAFQLWLGLGHSNSPLLVSAAFSHDWHSASAGGVAALLVVVSPVAALLVAALLVAALLVAASPVAALLVVVSPVVGSPVRVVVAAVASPVRRRGPQHRFRAPEQARRCNNPSRFGSAVYP
jgi:hypothetical protein